MISGKPIYDGTGAFLGYRHVGVDVTLRIAATLALEEQRESLRSAVAEADAANRSKSIFLANVSHELRTPLNAILGFSEALLSGALGRLDDGSAPYVRDIHASGRHLLDLISDVLDISRIEAGELAVREDEFDLDRLCADCLDMTAIRAQNAGVAPTLGRQPPTATRIVGDKRALRQILLNLLSNAVKFTPSGGTIVVDLEVDRAHGIAISVTDSGVGVPPSEREHIFTPFSRGGSPLLRGAGGSGLGLAIVRSLVTAHGGAVCVEDAPTGGARFVVTLPAARLC
ncbi:MAG: ATP-binding protein [Pseudomonadota bacterium]